jgi:hypothetical protein
MLHRIPRWYSPWAHLLCTAGLGVVVLGMALRRLHAVRPAEFLMIPAVFVLSNCLEWLAHRFLMHRRSPPLVVLYDRHTPEHHRVYVRGDMAMRSFRELRLVLIPALGVLTIVLTALPFASLAAYCFGSNAGWLFLVTTSSYVVSYELLHLLYHLPASHPAARLRIVRLLAEQHAAHHDPRLMQRYNFNVTVPLADSMFGTRAPRVAPGTHM